MSQLGVLADLTHHRIVPLALLIVGLLVPVASAADSRPNIIVLLADDLGYADVGFNGRTEWTTENLHRLATEGTVFHRWYAASVICAPSRAALMTGRYGIHNGVTGNGGYDLPAEEIIVAEVLKQHGYATALFGKWHHGRPRPGHKTYTHPMDQGFDVFFGFTDAVQAWQKFPTELFDGREMRPVHGYADTLFTDHAIEFLKTHTDKPFFMYVPYIASHGKVEAPAEDIARFKGKFQEKDPAKPLNATYAAECYRLDQEIGRILRALDELDLSKNTIVVFTSDHGATFEKLAQGTSNYFDSNRPFRGQKRTLWEGGTRVPAVVRWPGNVPAGKESHEIIHMCDLFPSFLAAAGVKIDPAWKIDGRDVLDVMRGKSKSLDRTLFWEWRESGDIQYAAMHGDLKMVITGGNKPELFNVETDPAERRTVAAEYPAELKTLKQQLETWLKTESDAAKQRPQKRSVDPESNPTPSAAER